MQEIDNELMYCPKCQDEYRPEVQMCVSCSTNLISGSEMRRLIAGSTGQKTEMVAISQNDSLVVLQSGPLRDMKSIQRLLQDNHIPAMLYKDDQCSGGCCGPEVQLHIRLQDLSSAREVLQAEYARSTGIQEYETASVDAVFDPQAAEVSCPACGHLFTPSDGTCPDCGLQFL